MSQTPTPKPVKDLSGYVAVNNKKTDPKHPDYRGKIRVGGKEYLVSMWKKDGQPDLMNVSLTDPDSLPPRPQSGQSSSQQIGQPQSPAAPTGDVFDDLFGTL